MVVVGDENAREGRKIVESLDQRDEYERKEKAMRDFFSASHISHHRE